METIRAFLSLKNYFTKYFFEWLGKYVFHWLKTEKKHNVILSKIESNFVCASLFYIFELVVDEMYVEALVEYPM